MKTIRQKHSLFFQLWKPCIIGLWVVLIVLCFLNRDALSVSDILQYSPANPFLAAFVMVLLFALKSLTVVLFCGFLYAAAGILFPLPVALLVNLIGHCHNGDTALLFGATNGERCRQSCRAEISQGRAASRPPTRQ